MTSIKWNLYRPRTSRSQRKHLRAVFIELNQRGPWTKEEKRAHVRRIRSAVHRGANGFELLPQRKVKKPPKPQPKPEPQREEYWRYPNSNSRPYGW